MGRSPGSGLQRPVTPPPFANVSSFTSYHVGGTHSSANDETIEIKDEPVSDDEFAAMMNRVMPSIERESSLENKGVERAGKKKSVRFEEPQKSVDDRTSSKAHPGEDKNPRKRKFRDESPQQIPPLPPKPGPRQPRHVRPIPRPCAPNRFVVSDAVTSDVLTGRDLQHLRSMNIRAICNSFNCDSTTARALSTAVYRGLNHRVNAIIAEIKSKRCQKQGNLLPKPAYTGGGITSANTTGQPAHQRPSSSHGRVLMTSDNVKAKHNINQPSQAVATTPNNIPAHHQGTTETTNSTSKTTNEETHRHPTTSRVSNEEPQQLTGSMMSNEWIDKLSDNPKMEVDLFRSISDKQNDTQGVLSFARASMLGRRSKERAVMAASIEAALHPYFRADVATGEVKQAILAVLSTPLGNDFQPDKILSAVNVRAANSAASFVVYSLVDQYPFMDDAQPLPLDLGDLPFKSSQELGSIITRTIARNTLLRVAKGFKPRVSGVVVRPAQTNSKGCWLGQGIPKPGGHIETQPVFPRKGYRNANGTEYDPHRSAQLLHRLAVRAWGVEDDVVRMLKGGRNNEVSHLCNEASCFNPRHLIVESHSANEKRKHKGPCRITCIPECIRQ